MELPEGITEQDFLDAYEKVISQIAHLYVFTSFEIDDIRQEGFLIAYSGLSSYDHSRPLANFLYTHLHNRLKNLKRDKYYRYEIGAASTMQDIKKSILEPIDIHELFHIATGSTIVDEVQVVEIQEIIDRNLPANLRSDYLKLKNKGKITKSRKNKVISKLKDILRGEFDEEG